MPTLILSIVSSLAKIAGILLGDAILLKWITAWRYWLRSIADPALKREADQMYAEVSAEWDRIRNERGPLPRD